MKRKPEYAKRMRRLVTVRTASAVRKRGRVESVRPIGRIGIMTVRRYKGAIYTEFRPFVEPS